MLVLTRRIGEEVLIDGNILVTVVAVKGNQVRLGITAPSTVPVARLELLADGSEDAGATAMGCPALRSQVEQENHPRRGIAPIATKGRG
jgi:carbon storage regulator